MRLDTASLHPVFIDFGRTSEIHDFNVVLARKSGSEPRPGWSIAECGTFPFQKVSETMT
jgi:hypothetical protein